MSMIQFTRTSLSRVQIGSIIIIKKVLVRIVDMASNY